MYFFRISFDFYLIFLLIKSRKKFFLPQELTWRARPPGVRRGTYAMWQSPGGPHEELAALTRGRRPRRRAHADAMWGATCGWIIEEEKIILIGESVPLFNRVIFFFLFRVGLCSHTTLTYAGRVAAP